MDTGTEARNPAAPLAFRASRQAVAPGGGRSVDTETGNRRPEREQKGLISSDFAEPSDGLGPSTPHHGGGLSKAWNRVGVQAFCKHRASAAMSPCSAEMHGRRRKLAPILHFGGIRRNACT